MAKSSTAVPVGPAVMVPSSWPLSHRNVTGPSGKPVAVADSGVPTTPLDGVTSSNGAATTTGAATIETIAATSSSPPLAAMRRGSGVRDLDLTSTGPPETGFDEPDVRSKTAAYPTDPTSRMADSDGPRPPIR